MEHVCAPLLPFLHRFSEVKAVPPNHRQLQDSADNEKLNCTKLFLDMLDLPLDDKIEVDLKQASVFVMCHLDRLALPHMLPLCFNKVNKCISFLCTLKFGVSYCRHRLT